MELDVIRSFEIKPYLKQKVKQFQTACIKNYFSERASYIMDREILEPVSGLYLKFSNNKLPHYHKEMQMRFPSKEEFFWYVRLKTCCKKLL